MKRISYAGDSMLTGDDIADAVVRFVEALGGAVVTAAIDVPVRAPDGRVVVACLLVGPASQLVAMPEPESGGELTDKALVRSLEQRTRSLAVPRPVVALTGDDTERSLFDDLEYPGSLAD